MSKLQIIGAPQSNFVWVTRIVATEKGVPYDLIPARPHTTVVDAVHPLGKIPVMRHGDAAVGESRAICLYIDRAFDGPSLVPSTPAEAARTEQWVSIICTSVDLVLIRQYAGAYFFPKSSDKSHIAAIRVVLSIASGHCPSASAISSGLLRYSSFGYFSLPSSDTSRPMLMQHSTSCA